MAELLPIAIDQGISPEDIDSKFLDQIAIDIKGSSLDIDNQLIENALNPSEIIRTRDVKGGPSPKAVKEAITSLKSFVDNAHINLG